MTRVNPNAMMFATVSGCAQTAVIRREGPKVEPARNASEKSAARVEETGSKTRKRRTKRS